MKYFFDCEFNEYIKKPLIGRNHHCIDLISIGIVSEDGREYYAICKEFSIPRITPWLMDNVIKKLEYIIEKPSPFLSDTGRNQVDMSVTKVYRGMMAVAFGGKTRKQIANEIFDFMNPDLGYHTSAYSNSQLRPGAQLDEYFSLHNVMEQDNHFFAQPEIYGWYSAYDWVILCSLYNKMINLPPGFPKYCRDLKYKFDETAAQIPDSIVGTSNIENKKQYLKDYYTYPVKKNDHNALADARWNKEVHDFLIQQKFRFNYQ